MTRLSSRCGDVTGTSKRRPVTARRQRPLVRRPELRAPPAGRHRATAGKLGRAGLGPRLVPHGAVALGRAVLGLRHVTMRQALKLLDETGGVGVPAAQAPRVAVTTGELHRLGIEIVASAEKQIECRGVMIEEVATNVRLARLYVDEGKAIAMPGTGRVSVEVARLCPVAG